MTYHYISLAIYRLPKYKDVKYIELHKEDGTLLPYMSDEERFFRFGRKKVKESWIDKHGVLHCTLEGVN